ncbi:MAG: head-tail adaptor protein [Pseudomonadota bacterium]
MTPPQLNRRFRLEAANVAPDGAGGFVETWEVLGEIWGELKGASGRDVDIDTGAMSQGRFRITVRAASQGALERPLPGQRLREGNRVFPILAVIDTDTRGRWLTCIVREELLR